MITVVGTGTGAPLPPDAGAALAGAGLVVGGRRHLAAATTMPDTAERIVLGPLAPALDAIEQFLEKPADQGRVVVLASGDPGFFGIVRALAERFGAERLEVHPGVSSVATAFARLGLTWDDAVVVSAHGRDLRTAVNVCRAHPKVAVLTGPGSGPAELGAALRSSGRVLVVASALGAGAISGATSASNAGAASASGSGTDSGSASHSGERVERVTPAEAAARDWGPAVSVVLCLDESRVLSPCARSRDRRPGPPDGPWKRASSPTATR